jgi:hypothetical protein
VGVADRLLLDVVNRRKLGRDITRAVQSVERAGTMEDAPGVTLTVDDPRGLLMESRLLTEPTVRDVGSPAAAKLRVIDLELDGVTYRLMQAGRDGDMVTLGFDHYGQVAMMLDVGPLSASRSNTTRGQFIRRQVNNVGHKRAPGHRLAFWSWEVDRVMPTAAPDVSSRSEGRSVATLADGLKAFRGIKTLNGYPIHDAQRRNMAIVLGVCEDLKASPKATLATCEGCIVEPASYLYSDGHRSGPFDNPPGGDSSSVGILQLLDIHLGGSTSTDGGRRDVALVVRMLLTRGFSGVGGLMAYCAKHPELSAGACMDAVMGAPPQSQGRYHSVREDAAKVIAAGGGVELAGTRGEGGSYLKPFRFTRGKDEDAWTNTGKLAEDVNRRRFITVPRRGSDLFVYAADLDLLRLRSQARIDLDAGYVTVDPSYDLDYGKTVQELTVTVAASEFDSDFAWGIPVDVVGADVADGKYLVWDAREVDGSPDVELTLRMPQRAKAEPSSDVVSRSDTADYDPQSGDSPLGRLYARAKSISDHGYPYTWGGGHGVIGQPSGSPAGYDCSGYVSACLHAAGALDSPLTSGGLTTWGLPGKGRYVTVWANAGHTFLELHVPGHKARWADTSQQAGGPSGPHLRYGSRSTSGFVARHPRGL